MNYKEVIESRYNRQNWQLLLHDIFGNKIKFWNTPSNVPTSSQFAKQALWLGTITLSDEQTISVYEVELSDSVDIERNRRGIRDMLLTAWRGNGNAGAFMFCYRKNESVLRFSYVSESWNFAEDGTYKKESTDTKRFTYLLGEGHRCRTAQQQFEKLKDSALSLKDLTKAFSVDAVSDMFFKGYKQQYEDIIFYVTGKRMVKVANKWEERQEGKPCAYIMQQFSRFANPEKAVRDYVKKLMGRLVFLQFLQKKGWLGVPANEPWGNGDAEFIQHLFEQCKDKDHFVDNVLESVFNDLNTERKDDIATGNVQCKIPYLNGGLFEREAADEAEFPLPAKYMKDMLDFFSSYNFTIDENDPDDAEVGVDPEMLGRIFENLLEDNKDKGAFYTPKEIVTYMCRESLIAYLQTDVEKEEQKEAIRQFVTTHKFVEHLPADIPQMLKDVKICDPAIGSGAFPMGLLKELFLCRTALEGIEQRKAAEIKKHIIQQNIYGVDIEKGAVDIARLRFWLSLIVDEETPQALPNLDFKIMQGNSLLEQYKGVDLSKITELKQDKVGTYQTTMFDDMLDVLRLDLRKNLDEYYNCPDHKRKAILKQDIINNVKQQLKEQSINVDFGNLDLSGNDQFMLWHTWFYDVFEQGGFDIIVANPPYVNIANIRPDSYRQKLKDIYHSATNKADLYAFFIERAFDALSKNGNLCYIVPHTWKATDSFKALREIIFKEHTLSSVVNLNMGVFDAIVKPMIVLLKNRKIINYSFPVYDSHFREIDVIDVKEVISSPTLSVDTDSTKEMKKIFRLVENAGGTPLKSHIQFSRGVKTSNDTKFIKNTCTDDCKKVYRGRNIKAYQLNWIGEYLWYRPDLMREKVGCVPHSKEFFEVPEKLVTQRVNSSYQLLVAYDDAQQYFLDTVNVSNYQTWNKKTSLKYLCGLLNSRLINFWYCNKYRMPTIGGYELHSIPIVVSKDQSSVIKLVDKLLKCNDDNKRQAYMSEIDSLVYHLYGLNEEEIKIVEGNE